MTVARVRIDGQAAVWSFDNESNSNQLAIHLTGIPTIPSPISGITEFMTQNNFDLLQPQYPGSFNSERDFTPQNCKNTLHIWADLISDGKTVNLKTGIPFIHATNLSVLSCHSFGTYAGMSALLNGFDIQFGIFFAPMFEFGTKAVSVGLKIDLHQHVKYISQALPLTFRMPNIECWQYFFCNESNYFPAINSINKTSKRIPIVCIVGDNDPSLDLEANKEYIQNFCSHYSTRIKLIKIITVPGGGHSVASLLTPETRDHIKSILQNYF